MREGTTREIGQVEINMSYTLIDEKEKMLEEATVAKGPAVIIVNLTIDEKETM